MEYTGEHKYWVTWTQQECIWVCHTRFHLCALVSDVYRKDSSCGLDSKNRLYIFYRSSTSQSYFCHKQDRRVRKDSSSSSEINVSAFSAFSVTQTIFFSLTSWMLKCFQNCCLMQNVLLVMSTHHKQFQPLQRIRVPPFVFLNNKNTSSLCCLSFQCICIFFSFNCV